MSKAQNLRTITIDADVVRQVMKDNGWTVEDFAGRADLSPQTISVILKGGHSVYLKNAEQLRVALKLDRIEDLEFRTGNSIEPKPEDVRRINEWLLEQSEPLWITASNQLQFRIWRLKHEHLPKFARGKCYDLDGMATEERQRCRGHMLRHPEVCARIGRHPNIIENITTCESSDRRLWWVIDAWVEGRTLLSLAREQSASRSVSLRILIDIAQGLTVLHDHLIVRRELKPDSILITPDGTVVLTEFELAKLLDGSPTVSDKAWPVDPYRAPEVGSDDVDQRADVYAWGRLAVELLTGTLPAIGTESQLLKTARLSKPLTTMLQKCVSISRKARPDSLRDVIPMIQAERTLE